MADWKTMAGKWIKNKEVEVVDCLQRTCAGGWAAC